MSESFLKIRRGSVHKPQPNPPANPENGSIYYDSTLNKFRRYENGKWKNFGAGEDGEIFLNNNQVAPAAITDLIADSAENKAFKVEYSIERFHQDAGGTADTAFNNNLGTGFTWGFNDSIVLAMREQLDGKILIAGEYDTFNGNARNGLVRLNADGTEDVAFYTNLGIGGFSHPVIYGLDIQQDGKIVVGGAFNLFNLSVRNRIVRLNSDGTEDVAFYANLGAGPQGGNVVYSVTVQGDGKIIFAGDFTDFDTLGTQRIARRNSDGTADATFTANIGVGANSDVNPVLIQSDNKILVGGEFTQFNSNSRNRLVRLNSDGTEDVAFYTNLGTGFGSSVSSMVIQQDGKILVGGSFSSFNSNTRNGLIRLNSDGTEDVAFYTNLGTGFSGSFNPAVYKINIQSDGKILVGGFFTSFNGNARNGLVRLNADGTEDVAFYTNLGTGFSGPTGPGVFELLVRSDNKILAGGRFDDFNTSTFNALVSLNGDIIEERMTQGSFSGLYRTSVSDWELGGFTSMGDASGVIFSIDSNGQVYYISDDITSTLIESNFKYIMTKL